MLVSLNTSVVSALKRELTRALPTARSAHLSEALARGLGFETNSVLAARVPESVPGRDVSAFSDNGYITPRERGRAAAVDDGALLAFLASKGLRAAAAAPIPPAVYTGGRASAAERPLLQAVLRCPDRLVDPHPETPAEQCLLRLADAARRAAAAVRSGEMRPTGAIRMRADQYAVNMELLPPAPGEPTEDALVAAFLDADLEALTRLSERIGWADDLYPSLRQGFMEGAASPIRLSHFGPVSGCSILVWETAAAVIDVREKDFPRRETVRLDPGLRGDIHEAAAGARGNEALVSAVREIVRRAPLWEKRDPNRDEDHDISRPYYEVSDDEGIYGTGQRGSFGLSRFDLVVLPVPGEGFTARLHGSTRDLARGSGPAAYARMLALLRGRCRAARDAVRADAASGALPRPREGHLESIEALAEACGGALGRYTVQAAASTRDLKVDTRELALVVERDLDTWLRSGGVPRARRTVGGPAGVKTTDFSDLDFVAAVDGAEAVGIGALLAEDASSRARAAARDERPDFANVVEDVQAAGGDIDALLKALRRHRRVVGTLGGFLFHGGTASLNLRMAGFGYGEALWVTVPHDETLSMLEGLARAAGRVPTAGEPLNFFWRAPAPHQSGDIVGIRVLETREEGSRYVGTSVMHRC
jgi:hypothetical protein